MKHIHEVMIAIDNSIKRISLFGMEPHIVVSTTRRIEGLPADRKHLEVPLEHVQNGHIVLKVIPSAVHNFYIDYEEAYISFGASFSGRRQNVLIPIENIVAITAGSKYPQVRHPIGFDNWQQLPLSLSPIYDEEIVKPLKEKKNPFTVVK